MGGAADCTAHPRGLQAPRRWGPCPVTFGVLCHYTNVAELNRVVLRAWGPRALSSSMPCPTLVPAWAPRPRTRPGLC